MNDSPVTFAKGDFDWLAKNVPVWKKIMKRMFDVTGSIVVMLVALPFLLLIALGIKLSSTGPVFFGQERVGYLGKRFKVYKFRTMVENASQIGGYETSAHDPRITPVGRFLRIWAFDELPQLWNILKGEMSWVGPRPTLSYQVSAYTDRQKKRLLVSPGLTGLAQISGRNSLSWPEKIELDIQYIENFSLSQDVKILIQTVGLILSRKGVYGE